jgi:hypothetical protein
MNVSRAYGHRRSTELRLPCALREDPFANCRAFRSTFVLRAFGRVVEGVCSRTRAVSDSSISLRSQREGSERPAVSQAPGTDVRFIVT